MRVTYTHVEGDLDSTKDVDIAKNLYNFLLFQYKEAAKATISAEATREGCLAANKAYERKMKEDDTWGVGCGVGYDLPYNESTIKQAEQRATANQQNADIHHRTLNFFVTHFMSKALDNTKQQ